MATLIRGRSYPQGLVEFVSILSDDEGRSLGRSLGGGSVLHRAAALGLLPVLLLSACTADPKPTPSPAPSPSPTYTCTAATTAQPCTAEKSQAEKDQEAAVVASTEAYKDFLAEYLRLVRAGGSDKPTNAMKQYAAGPYLDAYIGFVKDIKNRNVRGSGDVVSREFQFLAGEHRTSSPSSELTFAFCQDGRANKIYNSSGKLIGHGYLLAGKMYFRQVSGAWKIWDSDDNEVTACSAG